MSQFRGLAVAAAGWALIVAPVLAQDEAQEPATDDVEEAALPSEIEEIIVVAPKPGSRTRLDDEYEDPVRAKLLKDFYEMKELEEEYEWRTSVDDSSSRIKLGYDPRDEYRMRNEMDLQDLSWENQKPATIFRVEF